MKTIFRALLLFVVCLIGGSQAQQTYIGVGASLAVTDVVTRCEECSTYETQKTSIKPQAFVGYRYEDWAIESGIGYAAYRGHAVLPSRPADVRQAIDSRFLYVSGLRFFPHEIGESFIGLGMAKARARNYEHGINRDTSKPDPASYMSNLTYTKELAPFLQAGWQGENVRVSLGFIPNVIRSRWTGSSDLYNINIAWLF